MIAVLFIVYTIAVCTSLSIHKREVNDKETLLAKVQEIQSAVEAQIEKLRANGNDGLASGLEVAKRFLVDLENEVKKI